mmetsp:Transcript_14586/g.35587  ORF Transcript_14586/g.35587 Transcript_14586/m.35587 type:complete len:211 (-) Transcript_14586:111-743(-)|eukprot:CAMPEP_0114510252 /NCGR_PEP_ID=MMETSP0109-20121206/13676_1 /TAXON_ID=29199 /ORGANISM="Chlorarachnion reptans, Strain CCCM449" /LENGTH=210 /DNA_ID=CAMNT_0001689523 /DNA_START=971 /DNA_END=1603 /DNA_ORIENTATION=+
MAGAGRGALELVGPGGHQRRDQAPDEREREVVGGEEDEASEKTELNSRRKPAEETGYALFAVDAKYGVHGGGVPGDVTYHLPRFEDVDRTRQRGAARPGDGAAEAGLPSGQPPLISLLQAPPQLLPHGELHHAEGHLPEHRRVEADKEAVQALIPQDPPHRRERRVVHPGLDFLLRVVGGDARQAGGDGAERSCQHLRGHVARVPVEEGL